MHGYVAISWKSEDIAASTEAVRFRNLLEQRASDWDIALHFDSLTVYSKRATDPAMRAYVLPNQGGIIFGHLFRSRSPHQPVQPSELNSTTLCRDSGTRLLEDYWGGYVAILRSRPENTVLVIRDCSGRIPCYYINVANLYVFFSDIRDMAPLGLRFTLNTGYLASYIFHYPLHVRDTGLREVSELLAGDAVSLSATGTSHKFVWNPRSICASSIIDDYPRAESELRSVTDSVIELWASLYDRILLKLSGGLDSAIVLGCLKRLGCADRVVCVNDYTECTDDDERAYARAAAEMAGVPLMELPRVCDGAAFADALDRIPPDPKPDVHKSMRMVALDSISRLARDYQCQTIWTGQGGDHVFMQVATPYPAADYLMQHRLPYRLPGVVYDSALLSRHSVWSVLAHALLYMWPMHKTPPDPFDFSGATLMNKAAVAETAGKYSPALWHVGDNLLPPGKQIQIDIFLDLLNRHKPLVALERPYESHPLISQPLLELSLRIPTYHLLNGGRQRAMARAAFADRLPRCILDREDKGSTIDQTRSLIRGSVTLLREMLLDGTLVSLGILDRSSLERVIVTRETYRPTEIFALLGCIAVEKWARHWTTGAARIA